MRLLVFVKNFRGGIFLKIVEKNSVGISANSGTEFCLLGTPNVPLIWVSKRSLLKISKYFSINYDCTIFLKCCRKMGGNFYMLYFLASFEARKKKRTPRNRNHRYSNSNIPCQEIRE